MSNTYEAYNDTQLVQSYQADDEKAGDILCQRHKGPLYKFFKNRIRGNRKEDIEDLVQETFLEALKSLRNPKASTPKHFQAWFWTIAKRVMRDWINVQEKQSGRVSLVGVPDPELEQTSIIEFLLAPVEDEPEHSVLENEFGRIRRHFEEAFSPKALAILQLRFYENKTFREIGKALNIETGTAKLKCYRAVEKFRTWLEKHYPDYYRSLNEGR